MILTVSLNPAVDKYLSLPRLRLGEHQEAAEVITSAGGKAINVAGVLRTLGEPVRLLGFFGGFTGDYLLREVAREGIEVTPVRIAGTTRTAFVIVEENGTETELVEPGGAVTAEEVAELRARLRELAKEAKVVVLSGSVPPGCPEDIYSKLIADCQERCPVLLDTSRVWLKNALRAGEERPMPTLVKPNRREAEQLLGRGLQGPQALLEALEDLRRRGVPLPAISDGAQGLYVATGERVLQAQPPRVARINSVGSGDATVAGLAAGFARGIPLEDCLRLAVACGTANVLTKECAQVLREDVERLLPKIQIKALSGAALVRA